MEVTREIVFPESPETVWEALTEPDQLEQWFATEVEIDARPGGGARFRWANGEQRSAIVRDSEPGRRLVLDWEDEEPGAVELTLEEVEAGTKLTVRETSPEWSTALELRAQACVSSR